MSCSSPVSASLSFSSARFDKEALKAGSECGTRTCDGQLELDREKLAVTANIESSIYASTSTLPFQNALDLARSCPVTFKHEMLRWESGHHLVHCLYSLKFILPLPLQVLTANPLLLISSIMALNSPSTRIRLLAPRRRPSHNRAGAVWWEVLVKHASIPIRLL